MGTRMRLATLPTQPTRTKTIGSVRTVFRRADLLASSVLAVEQSTYFAGGKSPVHAEGDSEEVIYFRRGRGKVLRGAEYVDVGPGSAVTIPGGMQHHVVNTGEDVLEHILISGRSVQAGATWRSRCPTRATTWCHGRFTRPAATGVPQVPVAPGWRSSPTWILSATARRCMPSPAAIAIVHVAPARTASTSGSTPRRFQLLLAAAGAAAFLPQRRRQPAAQSSASCA